MVMVKILDYTGRPMDLVSRSPSPNATLMVRGASLSPHSQAKTWQAGQDATIVPKEEYVEGEDIDDRIVVQALLNQVLLLCYCCLTLLSALSARALLLSML